MIIIGYPGIGKTSVASPENGIIDLDSSWLTLEAAWPHEEKDRKPERWEEIYCKIARKLSEQGYTVFVSSHASVQMNLALSSKEPVYAIYPCAELYDAWVKRIENRYLADPTTENGRAFMNVLRFGKQQIKALDENKYLEKIPITDINYDLLRVLDDTRLLSKLNNIRQKEWDKEDR